jgi:hypothetical protein
MISEALKRGSYLEASIFICDTKMTSSLHNKVIKSSSLADFLERGMGMSVKIDQSESIKLDALFGRELDIKGQFKDRLIHQHLKRDKRDGLGDFDEPSENSSNDNYEE